VRDTFKLNQPDGPADGWLTQDALWLVSKPIADQLRAYLLVQGVEGVPSSNAPFFNMLQDQGVIQTNAQDKAIWKATIDNGRGWRNTFTLLKLSPALIWNDPNERPPIYSGTLEIEPASTAENTPEHQQSHTPPPKPYESKSPTKIIENPVIEQSTPTTSDAAEVDALMVLLANIKEPLDKLPEKSPSPTVADPCETGGESVADTEATDTLAAQPNHKTELGQGFVDWLKEGLVSRRIIINDTKALVHTVTGTAMLVTPGIFKRFVQEYPAIEAQAKAQNLNAWQLVQRSFEKLKLHRKTEKSLNIWTVNVVGPRSTKKLRGYLLNDPLTVFSEVPFDNVSLNLIAEGSE
jgi:hypothetical protein